MGTYIILVHIQFCRGSAFVVDHGVNSLTDKDRCSFATDFVDVCGEVSAARLHMDYKDNVATAGLTQMKDDLTMFRRIKGYMTKADPEYVRTQRDLYKKTSLRDELARAQARIDQ